MNEKILSGIQQKNLLIITPSYPNEDNSFIADIFVKNQVEALKNYFKKVIIIAPIFQSLGYFGKDKACKDYSYDNVEVYFPRCFYIPVFWLRAPLIDNRLHVVERCIREHHIEFDLIHAHFTWPSGYIGIKLREKYGKPVVITIHEDSGWFNQEVGMDHPLLNATWSGADCLIRVNEKDVPVLKHYNKHVYTIPNGFSPAFYPLDITVARERLNLPAKDKIIFTLGYLDKRKGFNYLIDAMKQIGSKRDDVICYIGGAGSEWGSLEGQIKRLNLGEKVRLLGAVPGDQLTLWMNACDLFVLPSLNEGNPTVMFEVLGCGKPFVGTRVGGVPEIIISDTYGLLAEPANSGDLARKIQEGLDREWDREAILKYSERFTWENITKEIIAIYRNIGVREVRDSKNR